MPATICDEMEFYEILRQLQRLTNEREHMFQQVKYVGLSLVDFTNNQQAYIAAHKRGVEVGAKIGQERGNEIMRLFRERMHYAQ